MRLLVTYATRAGSTAEVAAAIGETLAARGMTVDVAPVTSRPSLSGYDAVVLCSAIRMSAWLGDMMDFVKANQAALKKVPVALVTLHILNTGDDEASRAARLAYTAPVRQLLSPVEDVFFAGKIDYSTLSFLDRLMAKAVEQQTGTPPGDYRDWNAMRAWANGTLAQKLVG